MMTYNYDSAGNSYVAMQTSWRRDLDIRPLVMFAGLDRQHLTEVYAFQRGQFTTPVEHAQKIHDDLALPNMIHPHVLESLKHYSGDGFHDVNKHLWGNYVHGHTIPTDVNLHIENIKSLLNRRNSTPTTVYSGVKTSPATLAGLEWNSSRRLKLITMPAFTSTTTNADVAESFSKPDTVSVHHESDHHGVIEAGAQHILQLEFPDGIHHAASMVDHSISPHEEEVLLSPGHSFELDPRPTRVIRPYGNVYYWKAKASHQMFPPLHKKRF